MSILFAGNGGRAGSWRIRGEQLAATMGAAFSVRASDKEIGTATIVVLVKRPDPGTLSKLHRFNKRFVWDVVDAWPQPHGNSWSRDQSVRWLRGEISRINPAAVVFPTTRMLEDSNWAGPSLVLPHHSDPRYVADSRRFNPQRVLAYEGSPVYLGVWDEQLSLECSARGWIFRKNSDLRGADYAVALRDVSGYPAPAWKSNVKTANAHALGLPVIASPELGYLEFAVGTEKWVSTRAQLSQALDAVARLEDKYEPHPLRIDSVAAVYCAWLYGLSIGK